MYKIGKRDLLILSKLRQQGRLSLTQLCRETKIPISTIHDRISMHMPSIIRKFSALVDFNFLGFSSVANICLKVPRESRNAIKEFLLKCPNVNSLYKINNGYDFMAEYVCRDIKELEDFLEIIEEKFPILEKHIYYVVETVKKEDFLCTS